MKTNATDETTRRAGFSLLEVIIAITIFTIGMLGMGTTMMLAARSVTTADLATERAAARQAGVERLRALPYDSLALGQDSVGVFAVEWSLLTRSSASKRMRVVTIGPGQASSGTGGPFTLTGQVADTFEFLVLRP